MGTASCRMGPWSSGWRGAAGRSPPGRASWTTLWQGGRCAWKGHLVLRVLPPAATAGPAACRLQAAARAHVIGPRRGTSQLLALGCCSTPSFQRVAR